MQVPEREIRLIQANERMPARRRDAPSTEEVVALFHGHASSLFAYLRQHTTAREDAEDFLHEIFAAVMEMPRFGQMGDAEQAQWLWRVARNKVADTYRRKTRRPALNLEAVVEQLYTGDEQSPEYILLRREEYAQLLAALKRLPVLHQEALRLRFVNELPCAEVAKVLGKREGTVRSMLSRAIARLRTIYTTGREEL